MLDKLCAGESPLPSFELALDGMSGAKKILNCLKVVRLVSGKRLVCSGRWQGKDIFIKLYFGTRRAKHNWRKELAGLKAFTRRGIATPAILFSGTSENGKFFVIILEEIPIGQSLQTLWNQKQTDDERISLLLDVVSVLSRHHQEGLLQRDLHLNNFIFSNETIYTLDGGDVRVQSSPLSLRRSLSNLGLLFAQLFPKYDRLVKPLVAHYMGLRGLPLNPSTEKKLSAKINSLRQTRLRKYLKKIFRECTEFSCEKNFRRLTIYRRDIASKELTALLSCPDTSLSIHETQILKEGNTSTVWKTPVGQRMLIVKRYNLKGFWHGIQQSFRRSRASLSWENAHMLKFYGIQTAFPIALVEERFGLLCKRSYFITEQIDSEDYRSILDNKNLSDVAKKNAIKSVVELLFQLKKLQITHGDMKATNIFLTYGGPALIDLDSMRHFKTKLFFDRHHRKDKTRFLKNWQHDTDFKNMYIKLLSKGDMAD